MGLKKPTIDTQQGPQMAPLPADKAKVPALVAALAGADIYSRRSAAMALRHSSAALPALLQHLPTENNSLVMDAVFDSLLHLAQADTAAKAQIIDALVPLVATRDATLRNFVIVFLGSFADALPSYIARLLTDADKDVRLYALDIMRGMPGPLVSPYLAQVFASAQHVTVVISAIERAAECECTDLIAQIRELPARYPDEPLVIFSVNMALQQLGGIT